MKNEYLQDTKTKIAKYDMMKDLVELRQNDIELSKHNVESISDELARERELRHIKSLESEMMEIANDINAIEKGLEYLNPTSYAIIDLKYRKKESWVSVALKTGYGQSRCKELGKEALMVVGEYLHGISIHKDLPLVSGQSCY